MSGRIASAALLLTVAAWCAPPLPDLGVHGSLHGRLPFPADNAWNRPIDKAPVAANSAALISSIGKDRPLHADFGSFWEGQPIGIPYAVVDSQTPRLPVRFEIAEESDAGPYPIPAKAPVEAGDDRHMLLVDRDAWKLYELYQAFPDGKKGYKAGSGAIFDLNSNKLRPEGWTSADAAGLPIFPGLVRYDEVVEQGEIRHALRFTARRTRKAFVAPARHYASDSTDPNLPPMGMRVRLKASYDISAFPKHAQVVLRALKTYGMILADNGSDWYVSGTHDERWDNDEMAAIQRVTGRDLEVVRP
ncbi:MAG: hypothetical protein J0I12_23535 [Candidatus Eremiobacteraeota bacterium]|nr:hypothetical protein [Candidatus Eremiobacteraeota bacterium]